MMSISRDGRNKGTFLIFPDFHSVRVQAEMPLTVICLHQFSRVNLPMKRNDYLNRLVNLDVDGLVDVGIQMLGVKGQC